MNEARIEIDLFDEIFSLVDAGISVDYDFFEYHLTIGDGYIETAIIAILDGVNVGQEQIQIDSFEIFRLVKSARGGIYDAKGYWISFVMNFRRGEQVSVNFEYG
ncbi:hypothetical protein FHY13_000975 [Xanthomonas arboricola]|uniref:hypothetical protein n=1 Tax=Xanthomonas euroxanthea TaxID=2259622 RepID=UPI00161C2DEC|nr:hypothetical protein [Xanthomonas euroxanthea]MBB3812669.1 hypothetical protein [Xanthomonas euroxanthea]